MGNELRGPQETRRKIMSLEEAKRWRRRQSGVVAFTNGVFDLIHPGHVEVLEQARSEGDCLIVAVNDDESARRLGKGAGRPIVLLDARMRVIAGLESTDCVVAFTEDTPERVITELEPDILVKGADYRGKHLPGERLVVSRGGRVVLVPLVGGHSTTTIVERIRAATR